MKGGVGLFMALGVLETLGRLQAKDYLTLANATSGLMAILFALFPVSLAPFYFIVFAMFFDYMDGKVARRMKKADAFGKQLDSLADGVSFAAAPAVLVLVNNFNDVLAIAGGVVYACAGLIRLANYNLQKEKKVYFGLPIPAAAFGVVSVFYLSYYSFLPYFTGWLALYAASALMLSRFKLKKI